MRAAPFSGRRGMAEAPDRGSVSGTPAGALAPRQDGLRRRLWAYGKKAIWMRPSNGRPVWQEIVRIGHFEKGARMSWAVTDRPSCVPAARPFMAAATLP